MQEYAVTMITGPKISCDYLINFSLKTVYLENSYDSHSSFCMILYIRAIAIGESLYGLKN